MTKENISRDDVQQFFYGIMFDEDVVAQLTEAQGLVAVDYTKPKKPSKFHMTLRHLPREWDRPTGVASKALAAANGLHQSFGGEFKFTLDRFATFPRPWSKVENEHTVYMGTQKRGTLLELAGALCAPDSWTPHVTLGFGTLQREDGRVAPPELNLQPIEVTVREVYLLGSSETDQYEIIKRFEL